MLKVGRRQADVGDLIGVRGSKRQGAILVLVILLLPIILLLAAMAINFAYVELNRTELMTATDAAVRAGCRELAVSGSQDEATNRAIQFAALNDVAGQSLTLDSGSIEFGRSDRLDAAKRFVFDGSSPVANAIRVNAARSGSSPDGRLPLLMPNVFGLNEVEIGHTAVSTQIEVDIGLVLDRSGSMAYGVDEVAAYPPAPATAPADWEFCDPVPPNSRWLHVVDSVNVFLSELASTPASEQVSVSTYSNTVLTNHDLTFDYASALNSLSPYTASFCAGGTNIGGGIFEGMGALASSPNARPTAAKVIIVLTDGIHNTGTSPFSAAFAAEKDGVMIFTITFSSEAAQSSMASVASIGGGSHYHANSPTDLTAIFKDIAKRLPVVLTE